MLVDLCMLNIIHGPYKDKSKIKLYYFYIKAKKVSFEVFTFYNIILSPRIGTKFSKVYRFFF